jgi:hypothetical protein
MYLVDNFGIVLYKMMKIDSNLYLFLLLKLKQLLLESSPSSSINYFFFEMQSGK